MTDMYCNYDNCIIEYHKTSSFDNRDKEYLLSRYASSAEWAQGDNIEITFNLKNVEQGDLDNKKIIVTILNFRFEKLPIVFEDVADEEFKIEITPEISKDLEKGTYYCSMEIIEENIDGDIIYKNTVLEPKDCCFYIK